MKVQLNRGRSLYDLPPRTHLGIEPAPECVVRCIPKCENSRDLLLKCQLNQNMCRWDLGHYKGQAAVPCPPVGAWKLPGACLWAHLCPADAMTARGRLCPRLCSGAHGLYDWELKVIMGSLGMSF